MSVVVIFHTAPFKGRFIYLETSLRIALEGVEIEEVSAAKVSIDRE